MKIKKYLLEFVMIFLAVVLGFFAESYREKLGEKNNEREFVQSYIEDLKADTTSIRTTLHFMNAKMKRMDSLMILLKTQQIRGHENDLYFFGRTLIRTRWFQSNDRAITQLKNSGSLRLLQSAQASDSILSYQKLVATIEINQDDEKTERYNVHPILSKIFDPFVFDEMVSLKGIARPVKNPPLRSYDGELQKDLAFHLHQLKGSNYIITSRLNNLNRKAINTMALLKKEYELD